MQDNSDLIIRDCCEAEVAQFGKPDTICITVDVLREIVQRHSPGTCLHQIQEPAAAEQAAWHAGLDEGRARAAPAVGTSNAVAEVHLLEEVCARYADDEDRYLAGNGEAYGSIPTEAGMKARAARKRFNSRKDATPAAAAPVVLPEPAAAVSELMRMVEMASIQRASTAVLIYTEQPKELSDKSSAQEQETVRSIETNLRALLATATGLPAQAVPAFYHVASLKLKSLQERGYQITGYALEKPVEGAQPERGFISHGGFVGWWWDGQSPQAQADARDAERYRYLRGEHEGEAESLCVFGPDDMRECLVPIGSLPGELDAFIDAAIAAAKGE
ncbi:hypothetical protein [Comamonas thiooxydans]|nr:hypothetical protein [Comamonas thiooxydans]ACY33420.1 hypothetical protein CtCNB1_2674 [Comamonas thiooxydans]